MTAITGVFLTNSNVNSGMTIWLQDVNLTTVGYKKGIRVVPLAMTRASFSSTNWIIATGDRTGVENPVIMVRGVLDLHNTATTAIIGGSSLTLPTKTLLKQIWLDATGTNTITMNLGYNDMLNAPVSWKNYSESSDTINVEIDNLSFSPRQDSDGYHIIDYELSLREVR